MGMVTLLLISIFLKVSWYLLKMHTNSNSQLVKTQNWDHSCQDEFSIPTSSKSMGQQRKNSKQQNLHSLELSCLLLAALEMHTTTTLSGNLTAKVDMMVTSIPPKITQATLQLKPRWTQILAHAMFPRLKSQT